MSGSLGHGPVPDVAAEVGAVVLPGRREREHGRRGLVPPAALLERGVDRHVVPVPLDLRVRTAALAGAREREGLALAGRRTARADPGLAGGN